MKILFVTQVWPQNNECNMYSDFMSEFVNNGHEVCVLVLNEKRNNQKTHLTKSHGCDVIKVRCGNIQKTNKYQKVISSVLAGPKLKRAMKKYSPHSKYDYIIWALTTTLITNSIIGIKKMFHSKLYLLLKEYWPQDPADLGAMKEGGIIYTYFKHIEKKMLKNSDYIGTCSEAGIKYVTDRYRGMEDKLEVCPHCQKPIAVDKSIRDKIRLKHQIPLDKCVFIYGGNFGLSQGIDDMILCISNAMRIDDSYFVLLGSGEQYNKVADAFRNCDETKIKVMGNISSGDFIDLAFASDVGMMFLFKDYKVPNIPGKFLTYLNAEMPIIAAVDRTTDVGGIIEENNCGIQMINGDVISFYDAAAKLINPALRADMSANAKKLLLKEYTPQRCYEIISKHFEQDSVLMTKK